MKEEEEDNFEFRRKLLLTVTKSILSNPSNAVEYMNEDFAAHQIVNVTNSIWDIISPTEKAR